MFGLSFGEILIILVVALLVLGPTGMPKLARTLGKGLRDFRRATGDIRGAFETEFYNLDQEVGKVAAATRELESSIEGNHVPPTDPAAGLEGGAPGEALPHAPAAFSPKPLAATEAARAPEGTAARLPDGAVAQAPEGGSAAVKAAPETPAEPALARPSADEPR